MKDYNYLLETIKNPQCLDARDSSRLSMFITKEDLIKMGVSEESVKNHVAIPFTRKNILKLLKDDLEFAFDKTEWNDEVRYDLDHALKYLAYVIATLSTWDDDLEEGEQE